MKSTHFLTVRKRMKFSKERKKHFSSARSEKMELRLRKNVVSFSSVIFHPVKIIRGADFHRFSNPHSELLFCRSCLCILYECDIRRKCYISEFMLTTIISIT